MAKLSNEDIEKSAIKLIQTEKSDWQEGVAFVTESVAFEMKNLIRQLRKNYWQVFNRPFDPTTGRKKVFAPLTRTMVDSWYKNIPFDQKDVNIKAKRADRIKLAKVVRGYMHNKLEEMNFWEEMSISRRQLAIDGTFVWRFVKDGKRMIPKFVDLLNCYIDSTSKSIHDANAFIERDPVVKQDALDEGKTNGWINLDDMQSGTDVPFTDINTSNTQNKTQMVELYRREGWVPKSWITGETEEDISEEEQVMARIIISDTRGKSPKVHLIEKMTDKDRNGEFIKSYEEAWADRIPGRWYGVGVAEKVLMLQLYLNYVYNYRINKNSVASLGIFKIKRGAGITPQSVARMVSNGTIKLNDMGDIENFPIAEASQQSYVEEENIFNWAQRTTNVSDLAIGDEGSTTQTATVGAIVARSSASGFIDVQKGLGKFVERGINKHLMKTWTKHIKKGEIVRLTLDNEELLEFDKEIADMAAEQFLKDKKKEGIQFIPLEDVEEAQRKAIELVSNGQTERFSEVLEDIDITEFDVEVYVKTDKIDKNILVTDLINFARIAPEFRIQVAQQLNDILGINLKTEQIQQQLDQQSGGQRTPEIKQPQREEQALVSANTMQGRGISI